MIQFVFGVLIDYLIYLQLSIRTFKMEGINRESLLPVAQDTLKNLIYSVICDVCNEVITNCPNADSKVVLTAANAVIDKYVGEGVKVRKKPAPRSKTAVKPAQKKVDLYTAVKSRNDEMKIPSWMKHPHNDEYSFATIKFPTGYPVRNNKTGKLVGVATDNEVHALTKDDITYARMYSLEIDEA